jgi:hypothetical protein
MNKGEWKILEVALNVLDNLVFVEWAKYEARKREEAEKTGQSKRGPEKEGQEPTRVL